MEKIVFRSNADGSAVCPHRDLSVCSWCALDDRVIEVAGAHFVLPDRFDRRRLLATLAAAR